MGRFCVAAALLFVALTPRSSYAAASMTSIFVFGDSTVDTGNNNYIASTVRANHPPFGRDLVPPIPTGRFSNGKLAVDFVADYYGFPYPVNFEDPSSRGIGWLRGVNFASAGAGIIDDTGATDGVVSFSQQIQNFKTVTQTVSDLIGAAAAREYFGRSSLLVISIGSNDFLANYEANSDLQRQYTFEQFQSLMTSRLAEGIEILYSLGGRRFLVNGMGPLGCIPVELSIGFSRNGECIQQVTNFVLGFNNALFSTLSQLRSSLQDSNILYGNVYDAILDIIINPSLYGFQVVNRACCGYGGPYNGMGKCLQYSTNTCPDATGYVFWDYFHPTQAVYAILARGLISGPPYLVYPFNLDYMFSS